MKIKIHGTAFLVICTLSLIGIGFSAWAIGGDTITVNGNSTIANTKEAMALTFVESDIGSVCKDGFFANDEIVDKQEVTFKFVLDVNKAKNGLLKSDNSIDYNTLLTISNCTASVQTSNFDSAKVVNNHTNAITNLTGTFSQYDSVKKTETYSADFNIPIDISLDLFSFSVVYTFKGNLYPIFTDELLLNLDIKQI